MNTPKKNNEINLLLTLSVFVDVKFLVATAEQVDHLNKSPYITMAYIHVAADIS